MEVLQDGVLAFLAATGAAALFWLLTGWLRRREPARGRAAGSRPGAVIFPARWPSCWTCGGSCGPAAHRDLRLRTG